METFTYFMENYFIYIWLALVISILSFFFIRGKKTLEEFGSVDDSTVLFSEKRASGYSLKSRTTRFGGAGKTLHVFVTNTELIIKSSLFMAAIAKRYDLLHRIRFENITEATIKKGILKSRLHVCFTSKNDEAHEIVIQSKRIERIKELLDSQINAK